MTTRVQRARARVNALRESMLNEEGPITFEAINYKAAQATVAIGEAYNAVLGFKGLIDRMDEIPASLHRQYARTGKILDALARAKAEAYQSQMELRRLR